MFYSCVLFSFFNQRQCTDAGIAAHMRECDYMSCRLAVCVPLLVLRSLANHLPPRFKSVQAVVPGADPVFLARRYEPAAHKQGDCYFFVPLLLREIQGSFIIEE